MRITIIKPNMLNERTNAAMQPLFAAALKALSEDNAQILFFNDLQLKPVTVGLLAKEALKKIIKSNQDKPEKCLK